MGGELAHFVSYKQMAILLQISIRASVSPPPYLTSSIVEFSGHWSTTQQPTMNPIFYCNFIVFAEISTLRAFSAIHIIIKYSNHCSLSLQFFGWPPCALISEASYHPSYVSLSSSKYIDTINRLDCALSERLPCFFRPCLSCAPPSRRTVWRLI